MKVTRRRGRRRKKLLDDHKDRRGYSHLLDSPMRTALFGRGFGPVVRQDIEWMNISAECPAIGSPNFVRVNYKFAFRFCRISDHEICSYGVGLVRLSNAAAFWTLPNDIWVVGFISNTVRSFLTNMCSFAILYLQGAANIFLKWPLRSPLFLVTPVTSTWENTIQPSYFILCDSCLACQNSSAGDFASNNMLCIDTKNW